MRRIIYSLVTGCILTAAGLILVESTIRTASNFPKLVSSALVFPGYALALLLTLGRFHDVSLSMIAIANVVVYSTVTYLSIMLLSKLKGHSED